MRQKSLELRDESLSYKTEKSVIHVRQRNRAGSTTKERKTRKIEIERNTYKPLMSVSGRRCFFFFWLPATYLWKWKSGGERERESDVLRIHFFWVRIKYEMY